MTEKNELTKIKDAVLKAEENSEKSLLIQLFGDTPKSRILDFLIANKGDPFQKRKYRGVQMFLKPRFSSRTKISTIMITSGTWFV